MKQRVALVAYEQVNGRYDIHLSTYIGRNLQLCERIAKETPHGHGGRDYEPTLVKEDAMTSNRTLQ